MPDTHLNGVQHALASTSGAGATLTLGAVSTDYAAFQSGDNAKTFSIEIFEAGKGREWRAACPLTFSGLTLGAGTFIGSTTGSPISTFTSAAKVSVVALGDPFGNALELQLNRGFVLVDCTGGTQQSISSGAFTKLAAAYDTEVQDPNGWWDHTNKQFIPNKPGTYLIKASVGILSFSTSGIYQSFLYLNGGSYECGAQLTNVSGTVVVPGTYLVKMNGTTDYVEAYFRHTTGVSQNTSGTPANTFFRAIFLGP